MYDLIIIGGSAAATTASIYAARRGLKFKLITKEFGGEVATSGEIGNWPGIIKTDGLALSEQFKDHLKHYNVELEEGISVQKISKRDNGTFCVSSSTGEMPASAAEKLPANGDDTLKCDYEAKAVIITTGVHPRELNVPGEKELRNRGVSYCTTCDGPLFADKVTATIGGGNSALESALMLSDISSKVYVVNKNPKFKGEDVLVENLKSKKNVEIINNANTSEIIGDKFVTSLKYKDESDKDQEIKVDGIFVHIGMIPNSNIVPDDVERDKFGQILISANCETNIPGLYAAGDVTDVPFNQIIIAAGQGCIATLSAVNYLNKLK